MNHIDNKAIDHFKQRIQHFSINNHLKYRYALYGLIKRDFIIKYRRSILGILWSVLNPLLMMIVISAVFSYLFRFDIQNYPIYYLTGYILFTMYATATHDSISSIIGASGIIKKMYIPKYLFPIEKCTFAFVNTSVSIIALIIVILFFKIKIHFSWILIPLPFIFTFIFSIGISFILSSLNVYFRDIGHLYSIVITLLLYATPIFYPVKILPPNIMSIMEWNPLYHFISYFRTIILDGALPTAMETYICSGFAFGTFMFGAIVFRLLQNKFILYI